MKITASISNFRTAAILTLSMLAVSSPNGFAEEILSLDQARAFYQLVKISGITTLSPTFAPDVSQSASTLTTMEIKTPMGPVDYNIVDDYQNGDSYIFAMFGNGAGYGDINLTAYFSHDPRISIPRFFLNHFDPIAKAKLRNFRALPQAEQDTITAVYHAISSAREKSRTGDAAIALAILRSIAH